MAKFKVEGTLYELLTPEQYASLSNSVGKVELDNRVRFITETEYDTLKTNNNIEENITYIVYR